MSNEGPPRLTDLGHPIYRLKQPIEFELVANGAVVVVANDPLRVTALGATLDEALADAASQLKRLFEEYQSLVADGLTLLPAEQRIYGALCSLIELRPP